MPITTQAALSFEPPNLLIKRFSQTEELSEIEAGQLFTETKKFLVMCSMNRGIRYSPSPSIDAMWHQFILHTRAYFDFCDRLGAFIHHQPTESGSDGDYEITKRHFRHYFGSMNEKFWTNKPADCDNNDCTSNDCCPVVG